jgi:hypothetical protein
MHDPLLKRAERAIRDGQRISTDVRETLQRARLAAARVRQLLLWMQAERAAANNVRLDAR